MKSISTDSMERIGYLSDPKGLDMLFDTLQEIGIPMGSTTWAQQASCRIERLHAASELLRQLEHSVTEIRRRDERNLFIRKEREWRDKAVDAIKERESCHVSCQNGGIGESTADCPEDNILGTFSNNLFPSETVRAIRYLGGQVWNEVYTFIVSRGSNMKNYAMRPNGQLVIETSEGPLGTMDVGDWIIMSEDGRLSRCPDLKFKERYTKV